MNRSLLSFGVLAVIPGAFLAFSDAAEAQTRFKFQYSAKFVCGTNPAESLRILRGTTPLRSTSTIRTAVGRPGCARR